MTQLAAVARVAVAMESSGVYGDALRWQLQRLGIWVMAGVGWQGAKITRFAPKN